MSKEQILKEKLETKITNSIKNVPSANEVADSVHTPDMDLPDSNPIINKDYDNVGETVGSIKSGLDGASSVESKFDGLKTSIGNLDTAIKVVSTIDAIQKAMSVEQGGEVLGQIAAKEALARTIAETGFEASAIRGAIALSTIVAGVEPSPIGEVIIAGATAWAVNKGINKLSDDLFSNNDIDNFAGIERIDNGDGTHRWEMETVNYVEPSSFNPRNDRIETVKKTIVISDPEQIELLEEIRTFKQLQSENMLDESENRVLELTDGTILKSDGALGWVAYSDDGTIVHTDQYGNKSTVVESNGKYYTAELDNDGNVVKSGGRLLTDDIDHLALGDLYGTRSEGSVSFGIFNDSKENSEKVNQDIIHYGDDLDKYIIVENYQDGSKVEYVYSDGKIIGIVETDAQGNQVSYDSNGNTIENSPVSSDTNENTAAPINNLLDKANEEGASNSNNWQLNSDNNKINQETYQVNSGDTVSTIMERMGLDPYNPVELAAFAKANGLADINIIQAGQDLINPFHGLDEDLRAFAANNILNAESQTDADAMARHGDGTGYERDSIVGFNDDGSVITAEEAGLWQPEVADSGSTSEGFWSDITESTGDMISGVWDNITQIDDIVGGAWDNVVDNVQGLFGFGGGDEGRNANNNMPDFINPATQGHADIFERNDIEVNGFQAITSGTSAINAIQDGDWSAAFNSAASFADSVGYENLGNVAEGFGSAFDFYKAIDDEDYLGAKNNNLYIFRIKQNRVVRKISLTLKDFSKLQNAA